MKEQFSLAASGDILALIDRAADRAGLSRGQTFEDFLTFVRCSLAGQTMEEEYLQTVAKGYGKCKQGDRGIDYVTQAFAQLVMAMEETESDVLGDIFTGGITYGERGQFFTPDPICELMRKLTVPADNDKEPKSVCDPACGSGRTLLAIGKEHRNWELTGQDVDHRCVQMTAINMGLNGMRGWAVWQNTLNLECYRVYRIGFNLHGGVIREVPVDQSPFDYAAQKQMAQQTKPTIKPMPKEESPPEDAGPQQQLGLF